MKILFVTQAYHPSKGGVQWMVQNLAEGLVHRHGDDVTVFTTNAYECQLFTDASLPTMPAGVETINGVNVCRFSVFNRFTWLRLNAARVGYKLRLPGQDWLRTLYFGPIVPGLQQAVAASGADVVVASSFPMRHMYDALQGAQASGKPVVLIGTVHPTDPWGFDLPRMYRAIKAADAYIALSQHEQDYLAAHGIPANQINIVGGGVTVDAFIDAAAAGQALRQQYGFADDPVAVLIGRQTAYKRADLIIEAMQLVWQQMPTARLLLAGAKTDYTATLELLIATLPQPFQQRITMLTDFSEAEKPAILAAADLLLQPSERESFGIVFLEAWAAGRPVIGARSGAAPTVIDEGRDGLLATYGDRQAWADAMLQLFTDAKLRQQMGAHGKEKTMARYSWSHITARTRQILQEAVNA